MAVLLTFALAGSTTVLLKRPLMAVLPAVDLPAWQQWLLYLVVVLPLYYLLLLFYGTLLGQYGFFRARLLRLFRRPTRPGTRS